MSCRTRIVYHELHGRRGFTALRRTWNRYELFLKTLSESPLHAACPFIEAPAAAENDLLRVHDAAYVDHIQELDITGRGRLDGSTPAWTGMYERAERVVGGSIRGAELIATGQADHVFNPAGGQHHAHRGRGGGFCVFNDVVAAVRRFSDSGFRRIAVLDIDGHHGDGTESLLYSENVLVISLHQFGERTYPGTGRIEDTGSGQGRGFTMNVPLARGTGAVTYLSILKDAVEPVLRAHHPDVLIVEFGTDGHVADPLLKLQLTTATYVEIAARLHVLAHELCEGRLLVVGGGGYSPSHVVSCWMFMLAEMTGVEARRVHQDAALWGRDEVIIPNDSADEQSLREAVRAREAVLLFDALRNQADAALPIRQLV